MRFAIYSRKSVYTGKGESIENQIEMCRRYIFSKFPAEAEADITVYEDEGFSAKNTDRPQFSRMLSDIRQKKFDFVVCYRLDRISRNVSDFSKLIEDLNDRGISFICIKEEFDTSKPMGKAMMYIASVFAQLERETIAERVRDNMLMLSRTGRWLGGTTPTGFTSEKTQEIIIDGKIKSSCKLKINATEIDVVKTIYEKFLELHSISGVSKHLIKRNIKSRSGKMYSLPGIKDILQNPVYCVADKDALQYFTDRNADICFEEKDCDHSFGLLSYNKRDYKTKRAPRHPVEKWVIAIGRHKGVVSGAKWVAVQNLLESGKPDGEKPAKMRNDYSLLSGMILCEKCGSRMFAKIRSNNPELFDYICNSKMRGGTELCDCRNIGGRQVDDMVFERLAQFQNESFGIYKLLDNLKKNIRRQSQEGSLASINARIKKVGGEIDSLINSLTRGNTGAAFVGHVNTRITELDAELKTLAGEQAKLQKDVGLINDGESRLDMIAGSLSSLKENPHDLTVAEKRTLIKLSAEKVVWDGQDMHVFMSGKQKSAGHLPGDDTEHN